MTRIRLMQDDIVIATGSSCAECIHILNNKKDYYLKVSIHQKDNNTKQVRVTSKIHTNKVKIFTVTYSNEFSNDNIFNDHNFRYWFCSSYGYHFERCEAF